jgi:hypothetical protein
LLVVTLTGCSAPSEPLKLKAVELGSGVDEENRVVSPTRSFAPRSTVYASITTEGAGPGTLSVQWLANTRVVASETRKINPTAPAHFAFHFVPPDGWPSGRSRVLFSLDDGEKHTAEFEVR